MKHGSWYFSHGQSVIKLQLILGIGSVLAIAAVSRDFNSMVSAILGAAMVLVQTFLYAFVVFRKGVVAYPKVALARHQKAMVLKFLLNFILFALVVTLYKQCHFLLLLVAYFATLSGYWVSLLFGI